MEKFNLHKNNMQSHLTIISLSDTVSTRYLQNSSRLTNDRFLIQLSERLLPFCLPDGRIQLNLKNCIKTKDFSEDAVVQWTIPNHLPLFFPSVF